MSETRAQHERPRDDSGVAMILVMAWGLLMMGLVLVVSQTVVNQIVPSDRSEHSYAALSAAEAGLADIQARLQVGTIISVTQDATNLALKGWVPVPGGNTDAEFTYAIDATKSGAVGEVRAYSMGRSGDVTRTVEAVLSKRSTLDYVYMSDIETPSPDTPGVYSTAAYGSSGLSYQEVARLLCDRRWVEPGPVKVSSTGTVTDGLQRNLRYCKWAGIFSSERLIGKVHTNDIWWLENVNLSSTLQEGAITSSCRTTNEGLAAGEVGCPVNHRFIATNTSGIGTTTDATLYQGDLWTIPGTNSTQRDPLYDSVLDLPANPDLLKQRAAESGCIFTGPTRIRFSEEGGVGYMYVTSPDTKLTRAGCDGADGTTLQSPATAQVTKKVALTDFSDLVIYVQDVRPSTEVDTPGADYDDPLQKYYWEKQNRWVSGNEPTCTLKGSNKYPFVIPNDATDAANFSGSSTYKGFPSEFADPNSPWYGTACASGDLYVQGEYKGALMLTSDNNVVLTSSLRDSDLANPSAIPGATDYGKPDPLSQSVLGIAAARFAYTYRPMMPQQVSSYTWASNTVTVTYTGHGLEVGDSVWLDFTSGGATTKDGARTVTAVPSANTYRVTISGSGTAGAVTAIPNATINSIWAADWDTDNASNVIHNWALLAIQHCFGSQDYNKSINNGSIYLWGSLAQKFRCAVGVSGTNGYGKVYKYDDRLTLRTPPYMLELSDEPWGDDRTGEMTVERQALGDTVAWELLRPEDVTAGAQIKNVKLASATDKTKVTLTSAGSQATLTSTTPGLVVATYEVVTTDLRDVRRLVVLVE